MRTVRFSITALILFCFVGAYAQTGKPLMKITVKDGAVIKTEPVNSGKSGFKPSSDKVSNTGPRTSSEPGSSANSPSPGRVRSHADDGAEQSALSVGVDANDDTEAQAQGRPRDIVTSLEKTVKGDVTSRRARVGYGTAVLDATARVRRMDRNPDKPAVDVTMGTETIMTEGFEGAFPASNWSAFALGTDAYWDDVSARSFEGGWSGWCAADGTAAPVSGVGALHPADMNSWLVYGPFDLSDANAATLTFKNWNDTETGWDYFKWMASTDGTNFSGYISDGNTGGWVDRSLDLSNVPTYGSLIGQSQVWIAFIYTSDETINYEGSYIDNVVLQKDVGQPNLYWTFMALSSSTWSPGASITADLTETNSGEAIAGSHYSRIYLSTDDFISDLDVQLGADILFGSIQNGLTQTQSLTFTVPSVSDGTYYLGAMVDFYGNVAESNEADNDLPRIGTVQLIGSPPDLTCTSIGLSSVTWAEGANVTAYLTEVNYGIGTAASHYTRLYLSDNQSITDLDVQLGGDVQFGVIAGGGDYSVEYVFTVPSVPDGIYYMGAIVDFYNAVAESNEGNNAVYRNGTIEMSTPVFYDLYGISMGLSTTTWVVGSNVTAYFTVGNGGTGATGAHSSRLYLSSDSFISESEDPLLGSDLVYTSIAPQESQTQPGTFVVPSVTDGSYYIGAIIDYYNDVVESNENNAVYLVDPVTVLNSVTPADLHWTSLAFDSDSWIEGGSISAELTVSNSGEGAAADSHARLYLSTNNIISSSDTQLGSDIAFTSIAPQTVQTVESLFTVPYGDGTYWVGALVDYYNAVVESDEENNGGAREGQVTLSPSDSDFKGLAPYSLYFSTEEWFIGNTIEAEFTEQNDGTLSAEAHSSRLVLSDNIVITETDVPLGADLAFGSSLAGEFIVATTEFSVPDVASGDYYVGVFVDVNDEVDELDESNNIQYRNGTVGVLNTVADIGVSPMSLTINEPVEASGAGARRVAPPAEGQDPFVPNRMIIKFRTNVGSNMRTMGTADKGLEALNTKYKINGVKSLGSQAQQLSTGTGNMMLITFDAVTDLRAAVAEYMALDIVEFAEPDYIVTNSDDDFTPEDPLFTSQWGLKNTGNAVSYNNLPVGSPGEDINIENAWNITKGSSSIIVAVIDDGVDISHPEFAGRLVAGYDFVNDDNDPNPVADDGHGNACAGIIGAADDGLGVVGVAPDVLIMPLKVLEDGSGFHSDIIPAIYFAVDNGARVISMSLGGTSSSAGYEAAVNYAVSHGVVVLAAAGNDNTDNLVTPHYPASYANVISVGAMSPCGLRKTPSTCDGEFWWGSNYGSLDFITPGTRIATTDVSGAAGYTPSDYTMNFNGTSAATPFAAGVAALILSVDPTLTPAEVRQIMQASAVDVGDAGYDSDNGYGRVNAFAALQMVEGGGGSDFVTITNEGEGILSITNITANQPWLMIAGVSTPNELSAGESTVLTVTIDWGMVATTGTGEITIESSDNDEPSVVVSVTANPQGVETFDITVSATPSQGGTVSGAGSYAYGQNAVVTANPAAQYVFDGWTESGNFVSADAEYSFTVFNGRALVANFVPATYSISASANPPNGGLVEGAGQYTVNEMATVTATALGDYAFLNWSEADEVVSQNAEYSFAVAGSRSLIANFAIEFYTIDVTVDPPAAGTIAGAGRYSALQTAALTATPATGFQFESWTENGDVVSSDPNYIFGVTVNRSLVAQFAIETRTVTVTVNPPTSGTVSGGGVYEYGQTATLQAAPAVGYGFANWTASGIEVATTPSYSFTVTTDVSLVANFLLAQSITFEPLAPVTYGDAPFTLSGASSSGLNVTFTSSDPSVVAITGSTATIVGAGVTNIMAVQQGDIEYLPASSVTRTLTVEKAGQSITFGSLNSISISDGPLGLSATTTSGLALAYESSNTAVATISGNSVTLVGLGSTLITASQPGDANHLAAAPVSQELVVTKGTQTITFDAPAPRTFGDQPFDVAATASSGLPVSFSSSDTEVATVNGSTVTIVGAGSTTLTATQAGNDAFEAAQVVTQTLVVSKAQQFISFVINPAEVKFSSTPINLTGTATSGLTLSYQSSNTNVATIAGNVLTLRGVGSTTITAIQAGDTDYNAATSVQAGLVVRKGDQVITFAGVTDKQEGGADFDLDVTLSSGLQPTLTSSDPGRALITNKTVKILQPGAVTILATHGGNANYNAAVAVSRSFCIIPKKPTIAVTNELTGFPVLTSSSAIGNKWFRQGTEVVGANQQVFLTTNEPEREGTYTVQVQIETCISDMSEEVDIYILGIEDEGSSSLTVYPNPFVDEVHIDVSAFTQASPATVKMYDVAGREQRTAKGTGVIKLDATGLSSGSYLVQIEVEDRVVTKRVVKVK
jgi:subtilisin family serine protease